jgi:hypothetical protein
MCFIDSGTGLHNSVAGGDKQFRAAISFVENRKRFGDNWAVFFKFVCLKVMFQKQFLHCFKIYKESVCFSKSTLLFKFETKFRSRVKGNHRPYVV